MLIFYLFWLFHATFLLSKISLLKYIWYIKMLTGLISLLEKVHVLR